MVDCKLSLAFSFSQSIFVVVFVEVELRGFCFILLSNYLFFVILLAPTITTFS